MKMQSTMWLAAVVCFVLCVACADVSHAGEIAWRRVPHAAQQEARQSGRPLLIYVGADFCSYCRKLERTAWVDDGVTRVVDAGFVPLEIDGQRDAAIVRQLGVRGFPAVIVLSPEGRLVGRVDGYREPVAMRAFLARHGVFRETVEFAGR